jgi:hypothetical protein
MKLHVTIEQTGKNTTGIEIPSDVVESLGAGKRPPVAVTINGFTYRSSIASMGGRYLVGVSAEVRENANVAGGDEVEIDLELDTSPRQIEVPADLAAALDLEPAARTLFDGLSYSNKRRLVEPVNDAKTDETRQRRIAKTISNLAAGKV